MDSGMQEIKQAAWAAPERRWGWGWGLRPSTLEAEKSQVVFWRSRRR